MDSQELAIFKAQAQAELMRVDVEDGRVTVRKGDDMVTAGSK